MSRGRQHKRKHRQHHALRRVALSRPGPADVPRSLTVRPSALAGPPRSFESAVGAVDQLLGRLIAGPAALVPDGDPTDAELAGSAFVAMTATVVGTPPGPVTAGSAVETALLTDLIPSFERATSPIAPAVLWGLGSVADGRAGDAAASAADRMVRAGGRRPEWVKELTGPLRAEGCFRLLDAAGAVAGLGLSAVRAGWTRTVELHLEPGAGWVRDTDLTFLVRVGSAAHEQRLTNQRGRLELRPTDPATFRTLLEEALARTAHHDRERQLPVVDPYLFADGTKFTGTGLLCRTVAPMLHAWLRGLPEPPPR